MPSKRTETNLTVSVAFPPELAKALTDAAGSERGAMSNIIRAAVARYLKLPKSAGTMNSVGKPKQNTGEKEI